MAVRPPARAGGRPGADHDRRRPAGGHARRAALARVARRRADRHQRRPRADGGRPDGGRGRRVLRPGDGARRGARGADRRDPAADVGALAAPGHGGDPGVQPQAGAGPGGGERARAGRDGARASWSRRSAPGPTVVVLPGPPRELQPMWAAATATAAFGRAIAGATTYRQTMLRMFGIPESEIAATPTRGGAGGDRPRPARGDDLPAAGGDRDRHALRAGGREATYRAFEACSASATRTRSSPTTGRRSTIRSRHCSSAAG